MTLATTTTRIQVNPAYITKAKNAATGRPMCDLDTVPFDLHEWFDVTTPRDADSEEAITACSLTNRNGWYDRNLAGDGIAVRKSGGEDTYVALWEGIQTTVGTIRDLCDQIRDRSGEEGRIVLPLSTYLRTSGTLVGAVVESHILHGPGRVHIVAKTMADVPISMGDYIDYDRLF